MTKKQRISLYKGILKKAIAITWKYGKKSGEMWIENELKKLENK